MTRKHYVLIAGLLASSATDDISKNSLVLELCHIFKDENPNFNADKFYKACYAGNRVIPPKMRHT